MSTEPVPQTPAGNRDKRLDDNPGRHLRHPVTSGLEHDRYFHDPDAGVARPTGQIDLKAVPLALDGVECHSLQGRDPEDSVTTGAVVHTSPQPCTCVKVP